MANDRIVVRGVREHNLKTIDVELPWDQLARAEKRIHHSGSASMPIRTRGEVQLVVIHEAAAQSPIPGHLDVGRETDG